MIPGMTGGVPPAPSAVPPDRVGSILDSLKNRREASSELIRQAVTQLEAAAAQDPAVEDIVKAAVTILRGPKKPGEKPDSGK
jgi:ABC-type transporter Mla subunit MlaD